MDKNYYIGLDMGTSSVGYAAADESYGLLRYKGEPVWGVELFDEAENAQSRRAARTARKRLNRRQQRVQLVKELFAAEIAMKDEGFYRRIEESALLREDAQEPYCLFNSPDYTDKDYHTDYPTIHHLIDELMTDKTPHDVRLVYLAVVWLTAHRGHFLAEVSKSEIAKLTDFEYVYNNMAECFGRRDVMTPWDEASRDRLEEILKMELSCSKKYALLKKEVSSFVKDKDASDINSEVFFKLISGSKVSAAKLFADREDYEEIDAFSLDSDDEVIAEVCAKLDDSDAELITAAKGLYDWALLVHILNGKESISKAKIAAYNSHKQDLNWLKETVKKYSPEKYNGLFRDENAKAGYGKYISVPKTREDFFKGVKRILEGIAPEESDKKSIAEALERISLGGFLPLQVNTDNRVIPYQLYWYELDCILKNAEGYLPFLAERDEKGRSVSDKLRMVFEFRVPYFVGPLNRNSKNSWFERREGMTGRIYPWNIEDIVDYDKSEEEFIRKMTNKCTYLPNESVLPKDSLLYHKFTVLNELNNLKIDDQPITVSLKQELYDVSRDTGEAVSIIQAMWDTNCNLMELLSDKHSFIRQVREETEQYYGGKDMSVDAIMADMYLPNPVKRCVCRADRIVKDIISVMGHKPEKIFIEMTRGGDDKSSGNKDERRTKSRLQQILALYDKCSNEDVKELRRQLEEMGDSANSRLQSIPLFLYYMQLGKCMYSGRSIELSELSTRYNKDHIYPQALVKDDSILNNLVLVDSTINGEKKDNLISPEIRQNMRSFWEKLKAAGLITEEKFKRLTRSEPFSDDEKWGFVNRQLTETSQSAKAAAEIFNRLYPDVKIVYVKSRLASEFRHKFGCLKSRAFNDLHHAKDAYLNIVAGNVYYSRFTEKWFLNNMKNNNSVSHKPEVVYKKTITIDGKLIWDGEDMLKKVIKTVANNHVHMTKYSFCKNHGQNGGFFNQNPLAKAPGLIPRKKGLDTEKYGGYDGATITYFMLVKYTEEKKSDIMIMPVRLLDSKGMLENEETAGAYARECISRIKGKAVKDISFPLGLRKLKINTVFSVDGFRFCLAGSSDKGKRIIAQPFMSFTADVKWNDYMKRLEGFTGKLSENEQYIYDPEYDKVTEEENIQLYDMYIDKLKNTVYSKRPNNCLDILINGRESFTELDVKEQARTIMAIHQLFGRVSGGCDLRSIGGKERSGATLIRSCLSNWAKNYSDVRIIDSTHTGLREHRSENLLKLL